VNCASSKSQHFPEADVLKGILIILVVAGHFLYPFRRSGEVTRALFFGIYSFHMPAFVFVSGLLAGNGAQKAKGFRWDKVRSLLLYYIIYKLLLYPVECLTYGPAPFRLLTESGAPWYLLSLAGWYCLLPLFSAVCRHFPGRTGKRFVVLGALILGLAAGYISFSEYLLCWQRTAAFLPFFAAGWCVGAEKLFGAEDLCLAMPRRDRQILIGTALLLIFAFMFSALFVPDGIMHVLYGMNYEVFRLDLPEAFFLPCAWLLRFLWYLGAMVITMGLCTLVSTLAHNSHAAEQSRLQKLFTFCGRHSLVIYILHRPIRDLWMYFFF
jgi:fucose 4-O-acetylase-like acetyltransferase